MKIVIEINTDNAAFEDNPDEYKHILARAINKISAANEREGKLMDSNGNTVGKFKVTGR